MVAVYVFDEAFHLLCRQEGQLFQFLAGSLVQVDTVLGPFFQQVHLLLTIALFHVLGCHPLSQGLLPVALRLQQKAPIG